MYNQIMNGKHQAVHHVIDAPLNIVDLCSFQIIKCLNDPWLVLVAGENLEQFVEQFGVIGDRVVHTRPITFQSTSPSDSATGQPRPGTSHVGIGCFTETASLLGCNAETVE